MEMEIPLNWRQYLMFWVQRQTVQIAKSIVTAIGEGSIPGAVASVKYGRTPTLDTGDPPADIWPLGKTVSNIAEKTSGAVISVVSDDANDTSAGTGVQKLIVEGIQDSGGGVWVSASEIVTMNGVTPVNTTATNWIAVNRAYVDDCGSGSVNAGNISITHTTDIIAYIEADEGQTAQVWQTTPSNTVTLIVGPYVGIIKNAASKTISARLQSKEFGKGWRTRNYGEAASSGTSYVQTPAGDLAAFTVGEKARLRGRVVDVSANNTGVVAGWGYITLPSA